MAIVATLLAVLTVGSAGAGAVTGSIAAGHVQPAAMNVAQLQACVEAGRAACEAEMGRRYFTGQGMPQDVAASFVWYQKAADKGVVSAMMMVAQAYDDGRGVTKNEAEAFAWYQKAAAGGDAASMAALGRYYEIGGPVAADKAQAMAWYGKAADKGERGAMADLARLYEADGDMGKALDLGKRAAKAGSVWSAYTVGEIYYHGRSGLKADAAASEPWYEMAAYWNLPQAQYQLARMYYNGDGVKNDDIEAYVWMSIAADRGEVNARDDMASLLPQITPEQKAKVAAIRVQRMQEIETRSKAAAIFVYPLGTPVDAVKPQG